MLVVRRPARLLLARSQRMPFSADRDMSVLTRYETCLHYPNVRVAELRIEGRVATWSTERPNHVDASAGGEEALPVWVNRPRPSARRISFLFPSASSWTRWASDRGFCLQKLLAEAACRSCTQGSLTAGPRCPKVACSLALTRPNGGLNAVV